MVKDSESRRRRPRSSTNLTISSNRSSADVTWVPPKAKNRDGTEIEDDDVSRARDQKRLVQRRKHREVIKSMDLVVDSEGFLVPRNDHDDVEQSDDDNSSSSATEEVNGHESLASIPYCKLVSEYEPPLTPSGHGQGKSLSTLTTAALTRTVGDSQSIDFYASPKPKSSSQADLFMSPAPSSAQHRRSKDINPFQSPRPQVPEGVFLQQGFQDSQISCLLSPMPNPSPRKEAKFKSKSDMGRASEMLRRPPVAASSSSSGEGVEESTFYIPGITAPSRSSKASVDSRDFVPKTPVRTRRPSAPLLRTPPSLHKLDLASPDRSARLSAVAKTLPSPALTALSPRTPSNHTASTKSRSRRDRSRPRSESTPKPRPRSESTPKPRLVSPNARPAPMQRENRGRSESNRSVNRKEEALESFSSLEDRPPTPVKRRPRHSTSSSRRSLTNSQTPLLSPTREAPLSHRSRRHSPPPKTPSSSSRTASVATGPTLSSSTGRTTLLQTTSAIDLDLYPNPLTPSTDHSHSFWKGDHSNSNSNRSSSKGHSVGSGNAASTSHASGEWGDTPLDWDQIHGLPLQTDDEPKTEEVSEAGAVVVRTRKVPRSSPRRNSNSL